jgi:hypothetical protein
MPQEAILLCMPREAILLCVCVLCSVVLSDRSDGKQFCCVCVLCCVVTIQSIQIERINGLLTLVKIVFMHERHVRRISSTYPIKSAQW